ncbi:uncharacterized protein LOC120344986 [Styela clava]
MHWNNVLNLTLFYLTIYLSSTGEKCWAPMLCNNIPVWEVFRECEMNEELRNRKKALEDQINQLASMITLLNGKLKTTTATTTENNAIHTLATDVKETTKPQEIDSVKTSSVTHRSGYTCKVSLDNSRRVLFYYEQRKHFNSPRFD